MKNILVYLPQQAIGMSALLIKDLCWVAALRAAEQEGVHVDPCEHVRLVSADGKAVRSFSGSEISVDMGLEEVDSVDAILLSAFWGAPQYSQQQP